MEPKDKCVWVRHELLHSAYGDYCKEFRRTHSGGSPNSPLERVNLRSSHLQRLFAAKGPRFSKPTPDPGKVERDTLEKFLGVVAPKRTIEDFIDHEKAAAEQVSKDMVRQCSPPKSASWTPGPTTYLREGFVRLDITRQDSGACFPLEVDGGLSSIYVKIPEGDDTPQLPATVRIKAAEILPKSDTIKPVEGTVLGREVEGKNIAYDGVRWNIDNPREENFNPLARAKLCEMQAMPAASHKLELLLRCRDIDLDVEFINPPDDIESKQIAVLRRLLQKLGAVDPDADYVELARAEISSKGAK